MYHHTHDGVREEALVLRRLFSLDIHNWCYLSLLLAKHVFRAALGAGCADQESTWLQPRWLPSVLSTSWICYRVCSPHSSPSSWPRTLQTHLPHPYLGVWKVQISPLSCGRADSDPPLLNPLHCLSYLPVAVLCWCGVFFGLSPPTVKQNVLGTRLYVPKSPRLSKNLLTTLSPTQVQHWAEGEKMNAMLTFEFSWFPFLIHPKTFS